ncbi:hypothetical protein FAM09_02020 [Niastella caeni]|uniref:Uncharacterized protein n=1 Tax=Niastella caeni TaxID=2569763 RepID=A0A4S8HZC3_9BACT|nr:hypothetical protein [Niastella caeni]THU40915.1 hypothetical protein FAM09_02020 [Niastella caeni]
MKGLTTFWKIFRAVCIVQLVLVAFLGVQAFAMLFYKSNILVRCIDLAAYTLVFLFVYHGLSILNYNYPDVPLSPRQKRVFNILYLINFILIAYLFAQVVNTWWMVHIVFDSEIQKNNNWVMATAVLLLSWFIFLIHLAFLAGMFRLRRFIHQNTVGSWYEQFDQKP